MAKKPPARKAAKKRAVRPPFGTEMKKRTGRAAGRPPFGTELETIGAAQYPGAPMPNPPWPDPTRPPRPPFGTNVATQRKGAAAAKATRSRPRDKGI